MRSKVTLILALVLLIYLGFFIGLQRFAVAPRFAKLEQTEATKSMNRCIAALQYEIDVLDRIVLDWSAWDDAYTFVEDLNPRFIEANLAEATFHQNGLSFICFLNAERRPVWFHSLGADSENEQLPAWMPRGPWPLDHPLLGQAEISSATKGMMVLDGQPLLMASRPILSSTRQGPLRGFLIMGSPLGQSVIERISRQTQVGLTFRSMKENPGKDDPELAALTPDSQYLVRASGRSSLHIFTVLRDLAEQPALLVRAEVPREISASAREVARFTLLSLLFAVIVLLVVVYLSMRLTVVQPMVAFARHVAETRADGSLKQKFIDRNDELGVVAKAFATLLGELAAERKQLAQRSYRSGKAEMAGSILHNIRNGLHPVAAFVDMLLADVREAPLEELEQALRELDQPDLDPERRRQLEEFRDISLVELLHLLRDAEDSLAKVLHQTKEVIKTTHSHKQGRIDAVSDRVDLGELVEDAVVSLRSHVGTAVMVRISDQIPGYGEIRTDQLALQQVLTNLFLFHPSSPQNFHPVTIRLDEEGQDPAKGLSLEIFHPDIFLEALALERLFDRGYTWGRMIPDQGLHWCANTVNGLGGSLRASRTHDGLSFHLWLPRIEGVEELETIAAKRHQDTSGRR